MKAVKFHPEAELEMHEVSIYYEHQQKNLGKRFLNEIQSTIQRLQINPKLFKKTETHTRCCRTKVFPFWIIFRERKSHIEIIAIMHLRKKPDYWKNRI